ncbi:MAG: arginine decarboxylase, partial [Frateuria sp.]|nr:arginine decarboxylase [Frateuria sp.]
MSTSWTVDDARQLYAVPHWSDGYVDVDAAGHIVMLPHGARGPALPLPQIVAQARAQGLRLPLLVRF